MTLNELYQSAKSQLRANKSIQTPDLDARVLICAYAGLDQADFIVAQDKPVDEAVVKMVDKAGIRRLNGEPISKIIGKREFWGVEFIVTPDTLSPRPETELIIERTLIWLNAQKRTDDALTILDLGTGTGCIPIALLSELKNAKAIAVDLSAEALEVAKQNAEKLGVMNRITFIQSDWFENIKDVQADIITSNPPYIEESARESLPLEVKNHDPDLALFGGVHGLDPYKIIFLKLNSHLKEGGRAFFEIGQNQLDGIARLVDESNLCLCESSHDLAGIPRVVEISYGDK